METYLMNFELEGKRALITGGTHGIGKAICEALASEGVSVAFLSRSEIHLNQQKEVHKKIGGEFLALKCDVLDSKEIDCAWEKIEKTWGGIDILINNVGGGGRWGFEEITKTPLNTWNEVMQKNLGAATQFTTLAIPKMLQKNWGRVITVTSIYGNYIGGRPWFNIAKVAQNVLMKNLAKQKEFTRKGLTFNSIAPGAVMIPETGWAELKELNKKEYDEFIEKLPLGRLGSPEEIANLVLFLASDKAGLINGASIAIDGGESALLGEF
jgi:3-oxoacyl-[acyl-carrier protein] reductase